MNYDYLYNKLRVAPMKKEDFLNHVYKIEGFCSDYELELEVLRASGFPLEEKNQNIILTSTQTKWKEQSFCFVDIETTGSKPDSFSIIEIGALKYCNGEIVEKFESLVYVEEIPEKITELTGISVEDVQNSPKIQEVLKSFREFLGDSVFVGHNVNFDYSFISFYMEKIGLNKVLNPKLCTIDLAYKSILALRYSLGFLNTFLGINTPIVHRAYADALTSLRVFEICLYTLPRWVESTQDLIDFSKGKKSRK